MDAEAMREAARAYAARVEPVDLVDGPRVHVRVVPGSEARALMALEQPEQTPPELKVAAYAALFLANDDGTPAGLEAAELATWPSGWLAAIYLAGLNLNGLGGDADPGEG